MRVEPPPVDDPVTLLPLAFLERPGGGATVPGPPSSPPAGAPAPSAAAAPVEPPAPAVAPAPVARPRPTPAPKPTPVVRPPRREPLRQAPPAAVASPRDDTGAGAGAGTPGGAGAGTGTAGAGTGDGTGGARPAYGMNPKPPYPLAARRLGLEGVVLLEVRVLPDGSPGDVRISRSSGHPVLDESATTTVRTRWRFIPARLGAQAVESVVTFAIRFDLKAS